MDKRIFLCVCLAVLAGAGMTAQEQKGAGSQFAGIWSGSWEGLGQSGGFELTLQPNKEPNNEGAFGGRVAVTGEPTYQAALKTVSFEGTKMAATYDFPPDEAIQISLTGTFDGSSAEGTWTARTKSDGNDVATGTWKVKKK